MKTILAFLVLSLSLNAQTFQVGVTRNEAGLGGQIAAEGQRFGAYAGFNSRAQETTLAQPPRAITPSVTERSIRQSLTAGLSYRISPRFTLGGGVEVYEKKLRSWGQGGGSGYTEWDQDWTREVGLQGQVTFHATRHLSLVALAGPAGLGGGLMARF